MHPYRCALRSWCIRSLEGLQQVALTSETLQVSSHRTPKTVCGFPSSRTVKSCVFSPWTIWPAASVITTSTTTRRVLARNCALSCGWSSVSGGCAFKKMNATKREANVTNLAVRQFVQCITAPSELPTRSIVQFTTILYGCANPGSTAKSRFFRVFIYRGQLQNHRGIRCALCRSVALISIGPVRRMCSQSYSYSAPQRMQTW